MLTSTRTLLSTKYSSGTRFAAPRSKVVSDTLDLEHLVSQRRHRGVDLEGGLTMDEALGNACLTVGPVRCSDSAGGRAGAYRASTPRALCFLLEMRGAYHLEPHVCQRRPLGSRRWTYLRPACEVRCERGYACTAVFGLMQAVRECRVCCRCFYVVAGSTTGAIVEARRRVPPARLARRVHIELAVASRCRGFRRWIPPLFPCRTSREALDSWPAATMTLTSSLRNEQVVHLHKVLPVLLE